MEWITNFTTHLLPGLGQASLVVLIFSVLARVTHKRSESGVWLGLFFGLGAAASMISPSEYAPGISLDARTVMLALAAPFGGPLAAVISMAIAAAVRIMIGGIGLYAGLVSIVIAGCVGLLYSRVFSGRRNLSGFCILGLMAGAVLISVFVLPWNLAIMVLVQTGPWIVLTNFIGIVIIGSALSHERDYRKTYARMEEEVVLDPLTKLANRRALFNFEKELKKGLLERDEGYSLILIDLDHFKKVNDRWGHDTGDKVLQSVALDVQECVRKSDYVVRYGGEEILIILRRANCEGALGLAECIREKIESHELSFNGQSVNITISAGVACYQRQDMDLRTVLKRADEALYCAKDNGRNRIEMNYRPRQKVRCVEA